MPDIVLDSETTWSISCLRHIPAYTLRELVVFEETDGLGEETSPDQEQEGSGANQEPVKGSAIARSVDEVSWWSASVIVMCWGRDVPTSAPASRPTTTGMGMALAGYVSDTCSSAKTLA